MSNQQNVPNDPIAKFLAFPNTTLRFCVIRREGSFKGLVALVDSAFHAKKIALASWDDALPQNTVEVYELKYGRTHKWWALLGRAVHAGDGTAEWREPK
jgi:hypothetical protein